MNWDPQLGNLAFGLGFPLLGLLLIWLGVMAFVSAKPIRRIVGGVCVICAVIVVWTTINAYGPRNDLSQPRYSGPIHGGEMKNLKPETMTPKERLKYNRRLNEENAVR